MQAWLAVKGPLLRRAATETALWSKAMDALGPSLPSTPTKKGGTGTEGVPQTHVGADEVFRTYHVQSENVSLQHPILGTGCLGESKMCCRDV